MVAKEISETNFSESESEDVDSDFSDLHSNESDEDQNISEISETSEHLFNFIKLVDDTKTMIRYVYHLSDIHIRNTQRHVEYREVFERTYKKLRSVIGSNKKISLIVITGDIMHTKTELSPEAINLASQLFKKLSEIASVIVIPGNHDCNLSNKNRLDALSPIVEDINSFDNFFYLKKSGYYQYYNIVFGVTSIFDDKLTLAKGINNQIWSGIKQKNKYKIALYHGPVHGAKLDVGYRMNNEELVVDDFDGYNFILLGDIHKYQFLNKEKTAAYAGSLIQQSYGESLKHHGCLKWDLFDKETEFLEINNDYGYCTINIIEGQLIETPIPLKPSIRVITEKTNQIQYQDIMNQLGKIYSIQVIIKESSFNTNLFNRSKKQKNLKTSVTTCSNQERMVSKYLESKNFEIDEMVRITVLHKKIYQQILCDKKDQVGDPMHNMDHNQKWKLLELKFTNTLSYGKDNTIDFRKYDLNKIIGIVAPNHYGKSAILDIILFCLFDKLSRGERKDILNKNENTMYCSLLLSVGSNQYFIERIGKRNKNGLTVKIDVNFYILHENLDNKKKDVYENLNGINPTETNKKISELIGNYNDYLTTCFCLQQGKTSNFIDMTQLQKQEYLNEILKLNVFEDCHDVVKDLLKTATIELKSLERKVGNKSLEEIKNIIKVESVQLTKLQSKKKHLINLSNELFVDISEIELKQFVELDQYNLSNEMNILNCIDEVKNKLTLFTNKTLKHSTKNKLNYLIEQLNDLDSINNQIEMDNHFIQYQSLIDKKQFLLKKIIEFPTEITKIDKNNLLKTCVACQTEINHIEEKLTLIKNDDLINKITKIDQVKTLKEKLMQLLKPTNTCNENELNLLLDDYQLVQIKINDAINYFLSNTSITSIDPGHQTKIIQMKKSFIQHLTNNQNLFIDYQKGFHNSNDIIIDRIKEKNSNLMKKYNDWIESAIQQLNDFTNLFDKPNLPTLFIHSKKLFDQIIQYSFDLLNNKENQSITKKINELNVEL